MSFISLDFLIFFIVVTAACFALPARWRWALLLAASYFFYAYWNASYTLLMALATLVVYLAGRWIDRTPPEQRGRRRLILALALTTNLSVLFVFKYFNFFSESLAELLNALNISYAASTLNVLLPVGISFFTFQAMSYAVDVYRGSIRPEHHLGIFATYIAFFPQLVAGPIERAGNMLPQFRQHFSFDEARVVAGLRLVLWGIFKKVVIADRVAVYVNEVYNDTGSYTGLALLAATVFFAFQIYCDFSAYSDIAIGTARILGFKLMDNFRQPYLSRSVREFWRRWHISLSTWFRDYLYIPLGGSRAAFGRVLLNLLIVFIVSGLWHGANWTFAIWGALHGTYIVIETLLARWKNRPIIRLPGLLSTLLTFALVCFAWIFFRANTIADAGYIISHLLDFSKGLEQLTDPFRQGLFPQDVEFALSVALIALLLLVDWIDARWGVLALADHSPLVLRWAVYYSTALMIGMSLWLSVSSTQQFIYFQF